MIFGEHCYIFFFFLLWFTLATKFCKCWGLYPDIKFFKKNVFNESYWNKHYELKTLLKESLSDRAFKTC